MKGKNRTEHVDLTPARLRHVLGPFASGLTVVTAATHNGPAGFTCQSFSSLSLDPALVTFSPARSSSTWPLLHNEYDSGDHTIVLGAVRALGAREGAEPLLFFTGGYFKGVPSPAKLLESVA